MISQSESGLSAELYNLFKTADLGGKIRVTFYRDNPGFSQTATYGSIADTAFDAAIGNTTLCRVNPDRSKYIYYNLTVDAGEERDYTKPIGGTNSVSVVWNGVDTFYLFHAAEDGIYLATSGTNLVWSAWTKIVDCVTPIISAVSHTEVHYIASVPTDLWRISVAKYTTVWTVSDSNIYLTRKPDSIAAGKLGAIVTVAISTVVPGTSTARYSNNAVIKQVERSEGVIGFLYDGNYWSDHFDIEVLTDAKDYRYRRDIHMSTINGKHYLSAKSSDGSRFTHAITRARVYTGKDDQYWSNGRLFPLKNSSKFLLYGNSVYAVQVQAVLKSPLSYYFGGAAPEYTIDVTDRLLAASTQIGEVRQSALVLSNEDQYFETTWVADPDNTTAIKMEWGRDLGTTDAFVQVALEELDTISFDKNPTNRIVRITSRDRMAWLSDLSQAEQPRYWESQAIGGDQYIDNTGTGSGGLAHSATITGTWKTGSDLSIYIASSNKESLSFKTFDTDLWNGQIFTDFRLSALNNNEFAGVVFRAYDEANMWMARYNQTADAIELIERRAGVDTLRGIKSGLGWANDLSYRTIGCVFRYADISVYVKDGTETANKVITYRMSGKATPDVEVENPSNLPLERGYTGLIGKGYSFEDTYEVPGSSPVVINPIDWTISEWIEPGNLSDPVTIDSETLYTGTGGVGGILLACTANNVWLTRNAAETTPTWTEVTPEFPTGGEFRGAWFGLRGGKETSAYVLGNDGHDTYIWYTPNIFATSVSWKKSSKVRGVYDQMRMGNTKGEVYLYSSVPYWSKTWDFTQSTMPSDFTINKGTHVPGRGIRTIFDTSSKRRRAEIEAIWYSDGYVYLRRAYTGINHVVSGYWGVPDMHSRYSGYMYVAWYNGFFGQEDNNMPGGLGPKRFEYRRKTVEPATSTGLRSIEAVADAGFDPSGNDPGGESYIEYVKIEGHRHLQNSQIYHDGTVTLDESSRPRVAKTSDNGKTWIETVVDTSDTVALDLNGYSGNQASSRIASAFDVQRKGKAIAAGTNSRIREDSGNGVFVTKTLTDQYPGTIVYPWYKIGSNTELNTGTNPDMLFVNIFPNASNQSIFKIVNGVVTPLTTPELGGFYTKAYSNNGLSTWKGTKFLLMTTTEQPTHRLYKSTDAGSTWIEVISIPGDASPGGSVRVKRFNGNGDTAVLAAKNQICWTDNFWNTHKIFQLPVSDMILNVDIWG